MLQVVEAEMKLFRLGLAFAEADREDPPHDNNEDPLSNNSRPVIQLNRSTRLFAK